MRHGLQTCGVQRCDIGGRNGFRKDVAVHYVSVDVVETRSLRWSARCKNDVSRRAQRIIKKLDSRTESLVGALPNAHVHGRFEEPRFEIRPDESTVGDSDIVRYVRQKCESGNVVRNRGVFR